ncbi:transcriptional regulator FtrA [Bosea sp. 2YAB26]|uniref:transcriptional regulator FtrA n=1 Tax=Bosea sp. 2YAB26 TaxID=3237478 RepID=UPI003F927763
MPKRIKASPQAPHRVVAVAYDRLWTFEYGIVAEVFGSRRPGLPENWYEFRTAAGEAGRLRAHGSLAVEADGGLDLLQGAGTIIVPGWRGLAEPVPEPLAGALRAAHRGGSRVVSICGGAYVLAAADLLAGRRATTHWQYGADFAKRYPAVRLEPDVLYVDEGDILTSAGSAAGIDLCLHIVRRDHGPEAANLVARSMVVPPHRSGGQAQFVRRPLPPQTGSRLSPLLDWMRSSLAEDLTLQRLSDRAGMSQRTFFRRFTEATGSAPGEWILNERVAHACDLLETTTLGVDEVAYRAGLGSAAALRHHFRQRLRTTPTAHRLQFSRG